MMCAWWEKSNQIKPNQIESFNECITLWFESVDYEDYIVPILEIHWETPQRTHTHSINSKSCKLFIHSTFQTIRQIDKRGAKTELHVKLFVIQEMELKCDNRRSTQSHDTHTNKHIHLWNVNDDICDNNNNRNSNNDDDNAMMLWQTETDWSASKDTKICTEILFCCGFWSK